MSSWTLWFKPGRPIGRRPRNSLNVSAQHRRRGEILCHCDGCLWQTVPASGFYSIQHGADSQYLEVLRAAGYRMVGEFTNPDGAIVWDSAALSPQRRAA